MSVLKCQQSLAPEVICPKLCTAPKYHINRKFSFNVQMKCLTQPFLWSVLDEGVFEPMMPIRRNVKQHRTVTPYRRSIKLFFEQVVIYLTQ